MGLKSATRAADILSPSGAHCSRRASTSRQTKGTRISSPPSLAARAGHQDLEARLRATVGGSRHDRLDAFMAAWVASLGAEQRRALGNPQQPDDRFGASVGFAIDNCERPGKRKAEFLFLQGAPLLSDT
jgi:hypothetical protein